VGFGPKAPAGGPPASRENTRDTERLPILGELHGEVMVFQPMAITEVSRGGVQIESAFPLHIDSLHELRLGLGDRCVVVKGRVVHCRIVSVDQEIVTYQSGLEFVDLSERVAAVIEEFIGAVNAQRRRSS
jgi:hypothetical protein